MPLYEYECTACHRRLEKIQKFSDAELTECPHCGGRLERTVTAPSFQFAGGGWYKDLYSSSKPAAGADAKPESTSDAKPAAADSNSAAPASTPAAAAPSAPAAPAPSSSSSTSKS